MQKKIEIKFYIDNIIFKIMSDCNCISIVKAGNFEKSGKNSSLTRIVLYFKENISIKQKRGLNVFLRAQNSYYYVLFKVVFTTESKKILKINPCK